MHFDKNRFQQQLPKLEEMISKHKLPSWEQVPDIGLYMDQVILLMNDYLEIYVKNANDSKIITPSMINNYVKMGIVPPPVKKKYFRIHLVYLLIVCSLKQSLSIATIKKIIPVGVPEEEAAKIYIAFSESEYAVLNSLSDELASALSPILAEETDDDGFYDIIMQTALSANAFKLLTEIMTFDPNIEQEEEKKRKD